MTVTNFQFGVLGPLEVPHLSRLPRAKQPVRQPGGAGRAVGTLVWGDAMTGNSRHSVQTYVMRLRRLLAGSPDGGPLLTRPPGYLLEVGAEALDLGRFTDLAQRGRDAVSGADIARGADLLRQALGLWRREPLSDVPSETLHREAVQSLVVAAL